MIFPKMKAEPAMQDFFEIERFHRETLNPSGAFILNPPENPVHEPSRRRKGGKVKDLRKDGKKIKKC
jgi:hypothetical protein